MRLKPLIKNSCFDYLKNKTIAMLGNPNILDICSDSRKIKPGALFIAVKGFVFDGHNHIYQAIKKGAKAVVAEYMPEKLDKKKAKKIILVKDSRVCMALIAATFYNNPSKHLTLIGITGTNGKTSITWLLESILKACGFFIGVIGTINIRYNGKVFDNPVTTPDSIDLQRTLYKMKQAGITHVIMEVSSHAIALNRIDGCFFKLGIFTNLSQDHLDFHKSLKEYFECKKSFFTRFFGKEKKNCVVLNMDSPKAANIAKSLDCKIIHTSAKKKTDIFLKQFSNNTNKLPKPLFGDLNQGLSGTICSPNISFDFKASLFGRFNLENILCAAGAAIALDIHVDSIQQGIKNCTKIPGRLEKIPNLITRFVFVDYAHTPLAIKVVLMSLAPKSFQRIITIFGCGGDRDRSKRSLMGNIACKQSDITIITSDNPRTEDPIKIIDDIIKGLRKFNRTNKKKILEHPFRKGYLVEPDRRKAFKKAVDISNPNDIIIAFGKGHETYQITRKGYIYFDDKEEIKKACTKFYNRFAPIKWTVTDIAKALNIKPFLYKESKKLSFSNIIIDSRIIENKHKSNQIFLAIKGERFDGHDFLEELIQKGIKGLIVNKKSFRKLDKKIKKQIKKKRIIVFKTKDTVKALGKLGRYQRIRSRVKLIAITGSNGKTSTKEILTNIFNLRYQTLATKRNYNNEIGVPLTLLKLSSSHAWAIVELGMNHRNEISRLSKIAMPDIAIITNTGDSHLKGLKTIENVARAKAEIFDGLSKNKTAILPADDKRYGILKDQALKSKIKKIVFFGKKQTADIKVIDYVIKPAGIKFTANIDKKKQSFSINSFASFMINNSLAAIIAAKCAKINIFEIKKGIKAFNPIKGRMNVYKLNDFINIIDDTYNANPVSTKQALSTLKKLAKNQKTIAVLADMKELGKQSSFLHRQIGQKVAMLKLSKLFVFGEQVKHCIKGAIENGFAKKNILHGTKDEITKEILKTSDLSTWVLIKGSRSMQSEDIIDKLNNAVNKHIKD